MTDIHRYYKCGCCPDEEQFCERAEKHVWMERNAGKSQGLDPLSREEYRRLAWEEGYARGWMNCHIGSQIVAGAYTDVPHPSEPPDDGYDEDPRVVGYPS